MKRAEDWINILQMFPHPEGGFYKETYRSNENISQDKLPKRYDGQRPFGTSIYFLLTAKDCSHFHRLRSDEIWHYHQGGVVKIHMITSSGELITQVLGTAIELGQQLQVVIPRGTWFAAEVVEGEFILVGCTVAPGFAFEDFELADRHWLSSAYPQHQTLIERFTKNR